MFKKPECINRSLGITTLLIAVCLLSALLAGCTKYILTGASVPDGSPGSSGEDPGWTETYPTEVTVPILMFHDVKTCEGGTWSISAEHFRSTLGLLLSNGYTPISFEQLVNYADGLCGIPEKPVCITLDDGYFSNYRNVLPVITELKVPVTVFMVCNTVRDAAVVPDTDENILFKMSAAELKIMEASPYVSIQSHSYGLHGANRSYGETERDCALPLDRESKAEFREIFEKDCALAEEVLADAGVRRYLAFSYPEGKYHRWTEDILYKRDYRLSVTTDSGHRNLVVRGRPETLFALGRMNVNDETTEDKLFGYLERK